MCAKAAVTSSLAGKLGDRLTKATEAHKNDETTFGGGGDLPPGIENGIARLVLCKFDTYKKGELLGQYFWMAQGVVLHPLEHQGIPLKGRRTGIGPEPIADTPKKSRKTVEDHIGWVLNHFRLLGIDTTNITQNDYERVAAALEKEGPTFSFRTWAGKKEEITEKAGKFWVGTNSYPTLAALKVKHPFAGTDPQTQHDWRGLCDFNGAASDGVQDNSAPDVIEGAGSEPAADESADDGAGQEASDDDLPLLGSAADGGDASAIARLTELGLAAGHSETDIENVPTWSEFATSLAEAGDGEGGEGDDSVPAAASEEPQKGEVWRYRPKGARKLIDVEITAVFAAQKTCNARNLDTKELYQKIPFDQFKPVEDNA